MKVLLINYRYFISGGPERYLFNIKNLLEEAGHTVIPFSVKSKRNKKTPYEKYFAEPLGGQDRVYYKEYKKTPRMIIDIIARLFYSFHVKRRLQKLIQVSKPDVAYILHHYNKLSPSVIDACYEKNVPVILRLSDFSPICPNVLLYSDGYICNSCLEKGLFSSVIKKCIKRSYLGSLIKYLAYKTHRLLKIYKRLNCVVVPSKFTIEKVRPFFNDTPIIHLPTFTENHKDFIDYGKIGDYYLYFGRIEEEKGVMNLLKISENLDESYKLKIAGSSSTGLDKKVKEYIKIKKLNNVEFIGFRRDKELLKLIEKCKFVILPSIWYENIPNSGLEAMSLGKPLVASNIGSLPELVENGYNGYLFEHNNLKDLKCKVIKMFNVDKEQLKKMGQNSRNKLNSDFSKEGHVKKLLEIFHCYGVMD